MPTVEDELLALRPPLRAYLRGRVAADDVEELVQETLTRVWEVRERLDRPLSSAYAVTTAHNLLSSRSREQEVRARNAHRLHDPGQPDLPEEALLAAESRDAAQSAFADLPPADRAALQAAYGDAPPQGAPGSRSRTVALTARLARSRSRARVGYLLALRRLELPTPHCRPVLEAISSGDARLQQRVGAQGHLAGCATCKDCAPALVARRRVLFGLLPVPLLLPAGIARARQAPLTTAAGGTAAAGAAVVGVVLLSGGAPPPAAAPPPPPPPAAPQSLVLTAEGALQGPAGVPVAGLPSVGLEVVATAVPVLGVPADEGFWVGTGDQDRLWVHVEAGGESRAVVRPGDAVSLRGRVAALDERLLDGLDEQEGRAHALGDGACVVVPQDALVVLAPTD